MRLGSGYGRHGRGAVVSTCMQGRGRGCGRHGRRWPLDLEARLEIVWEIASRSIEIVWLGMVWSGRRRARLRRRHSLAAGRHHPLVHTRGERTQSLVLPRIPPHGCSLMGRRMGCRMRRPCRRGGRCVARREGREGRGLRHPARGGARGSVQSRQRRWRRHPARGRARGGVGRLLPGRRAEALGRMAHRW